MGEARQRPRQPPVLDPALGKDWAACWNQSTRRVVPSSPPWPSFLFPDDDDVNQLITTGSDAKASIDVIITTMGFAPTIKPLI